MWEIGLLWVVKFVVIFFELWVVTWCDCHCLFEFCVATRAKRCRNRSNSIQINHNHIHCHNDTNSIKYSQHTLQSHNLFVSSLSQTQIKNIISTKNIYHEKHCCIFSSLCFWWKTKSQKNNKIVNIYLVCQTLNCRRVTLEQVDNLQG